MPDRIVVRGAREHNLKNVDVEIPRERLVVITGLSGSGKSSLAFDTLYAEGQRRYVESLSAYARQFLEQMEKPDVDAIEGLSPAIAIEQKTASRNPRSTVATVTEIYDYLRVLFARAGSAFCPNCGRPITSQTVQQVVDRLMALPEGTRLHLYAPVVRGRKGEFRKELDDLRRAGFVRVRVDGVVRELADEIPLARTTAHTIEVLVDRLAIRPGLEKRLADSLDTAFRHGDDVVEVERRDGGTLGDVVRDGEPLVERPLVADGVAERMLFSRRFACAVCGISLPELSPRLFSFNSPQGACPACNGLGERRCVRRGSLDPGRAQEPRGGRGRGARSQGGGAPARRVRGARSPLRLLDGDAVRRAVGRGPRGDPARHRRRGDRDRVPPRRETRDLPARLGGALRVLRGALRRDRLAVASRGARALHEREDRASSAAARACERRASRSASAARRCRR